MTLRRLLCLALPLVVLLAPAAVRAQEADADTAKKLLSAGLDDFKSLKFKEAKATLLKIATQDNLKKALADADKDALDKTLAKVDDAIKQQGAAEDAYSAGVDAQKAGDFAKAKEKFTSAAASEFLDAKTRKDAQDQLALVNDKIEKAKAIPAAPAPAPAQPAAAPAAPAAKPAEPAPAVDKLDAAHLKLAQAKDAMDRGDFQRAANLAGEALKLIPDMEEAKKVQDQAKQQLASAESSSVISTVERKRMLAHEIANVEFDKAMKAAHEARNSAKSVTDYDRAASEARNALNVLETNKINYTSDEYNSKVATVNDLLRWIQSDRDAFEKKAVQIQYDEIQRKEKERQAREAAARESEIDRTFERVRTLSKEQKYDRALEELDHILKMEPGNVRAMELKDMLEQYVAARGEREMRKTMQTEEQKQWIQLREAEIPWYDVLRYPKDWKDITAKREGAMSGTSSESEADHQTRLKLKSKVAKVEFTNIPLTDVIQFIREVSNTNIYVNWTALTAAGIDKTTQVDVHLQDVTVEKALKVVLEYVGGAATQLNYVINDGVVKISTKEDLAKDTITRVYDISDLIVRIPNFAGPRIDLSQMGQNTGGSNGGSSGGGGGGGGIFQTDQSNQVEQMPTKKEMTENIIATIKETIDPKSWTDQMAIRPLGGQLIVTQTAENHEKLLSLIGQLRESRAIQIAVEARFVEVSVGFLNSIGLNLDMYFNLGSKLGSNVTRDQFGNITQAGNVYDPWTGAYVPTTSGNSAWMSNPPGSTNTYPLPGNNHFTPIGVQGIQQGNSFGNMVGKDTGTPIPNGSIGSQVTSPGMQIGGTFLDDIQVDFLMQATQASSSTRVLTAPRLTLFNGQRAYVTIATERAYVAGYNPLVSENVTASQPIIGVIPTGTVLDVEATVSADRRYVTMTIRPQVNGQPKFESFAGVQLPTVRMQMLETTVSCPDGGTLLTGGWKVANELEQELGVPLLSKVPILNRLFTNRGIVRDELMLLILVRPKIIIQREEEEKAFPTQ